MLLIGSLVASKLMKFSRHTNCSFYYIQAQHVCRYVHVYVYSLHKINTLCQICIKKEKKSNSKACVSVSAQNNGVVAVRTHLRVAEVLQVNRPPTE